MFDNIVINKEEYKIFFDMENMRLYTDKEIGDGKYKKNKENRTFIISNNYVVCIDCDTMYCGIFGGQYYNILYYFSFINLHYAEGIKKIYKIRYFSKMVDDYLLPLVYQGSKVTVIKKESSMKIKYNEAIINAKFNRKNYVKKQSFINANMESYIEFSFDETDNYTFIFDLCKIIEKYLKISLYLQKIDQPRILLYNKNYEYEIGEIVINPCFYTNKALINRIGLFDAQNDYTRMKILNFIAENLNFNLDFLPLNEVRMKYSPVEFSQIYSAFEHEANKIYKKKTKNPKHNKILKKIKKVIKSIDEYDENKEFINNLINHAIMPFGKTYAHKDKLKLAFEDYLKIIPKRNSFYKLKENQQDIYEKIYNLRTKITHYNEFIEFSGKENEYILYFEWIVYTMLLSRIGLTFNQIENMLDCIFGVG